MIDIEPSAYQMKPETIIGASGENKRVEEEKKKQLSRPQPSEKMQTTVTTPPAVNVATVSTPSESESNDLKAQLQTIEVNSSVHHKKFGKGKVVKLNKNEKFIYVRFFVGEKKFVFPDAFLAGFLEVERGK